MTEQDSPPEEIWLDDEAINQHFANVKARYASPNGEASESLPMDQNEFTRELRGR